MRFPIRRRTKPGAHPGSVVADPSAPKPRISLFAFNGGDCVKVIVENVDDIRQYLGKDRIVWVNVDGLGDASIIEAVGRIFDLHALALEDVVNVHQRAKVEDYEDHLFIVARMPRLDGNFETEQLSLFLGTDFIVTFQERQGDCLDPVRERLRRSKGKIRSLGPDYLAYALLDAVIDNYFPILELFDERTNELELRVAASPEKQIFPEIHRLRGDLFLLKRTIWPHQDALRTLARDANLIRAETRIFLRDCYDYTAQIVELVETYREACAHLQDFYVNSLSQRMNEIMKVLTIIATIFMPLSFVAGVYGMNFASDVSPWNMPELHWYYGYPFSLLLMAGIAAILLAYFWHKGWLR